MKEYEDLILQRDRLEKEADQIRLNYLREFGEEITAAFQARIDCIALKKSITFCQMKKNAGSTPSACRNISTTACSHTESS